MSNSIQNHFNRSYKPSEVLGIFHIAQRKLSNWVDKRVTIPEKPAQGAGNPSVFNYLNLLEIGVAQTLFNMGLSLHLVREIVELLRTDGHLREWAENFEDYFYQLAKAAKREFYSGPKIYWEEAEVKKWVKGTKPLGFLICFFYEEQDPIVVISPYDMERAWLNSVTLYPDGESLEGLSGFIAVDLGKIRQKIDVSISNLD